MAFDEPFIFYLKRLALMVSHKEKGYLIGLPIVPTFLYQHLPLPRRFHPSENWLSSMRLMSVN